MMVILIEHRGNDSLVHCCGRRISFLCPLIGEFFFNDCVNFSDSGHLELWHAATPLLPVASWSGHSHTSQDQNPQGKQLEQSASWKWIDILGIQIKLVISEFEKKDNSIFQFKGKILQKIYLIKRKIWWMSYMCKHLTYSKSKSHEKSHASYRKVYTCMCI